MARIISQRQPQHLAGLSFVVLLHVLIIYAFLNGLASRPASNAPPPLLVRLMTPERLKATDQSSIKPRLQQAPPVQFRLPQIELISPLLPPTKPLIDGPPIGPVLTGKTGTPIPIGITGVAPTQTASASDCTNAASLASWIEYPARARRLGIYQGQVNVEFSVAAGGALAIEDVRASNPVFEGAALDAIKKLHCSAGRYRLPISFVLQQ